MIIPQSMSVHRVCSYQMTFIGLNKSDQYKLDCKHVCSMMYSYQPILQRLYKVKLQRQYCARELCKVCKSMFCDSFLKKQCIAAFHISQWWENIVPVPGNLKQNSSIHNRCYFLCDSFNYLLCFKINN